MIPATLLESCHNKDHFREVASSGSGRVLQPRSARLS
jgi:hypothetical protein